MENKLKIQKNAILRFFEHLDGNYWKTIEEIAIATKLDAAIVAEMLRRRAISYDHHIDLSKESHCIHHEQFFEIRLL